MRASLAWQNARLQRGRPFIPAPSVLPRPDKPSPLPDSTRMNGAAALKRVAPDVAGRPRLLRKALTCRRCSPRTKPLGANAFATAWQLLETLKLKAHHRGAMMLKSNSLMSPSVLQVWRELRSCLVWRLRWKTVSSPSQSDTLPRCNCAAWSRNTS